MTHQITITESDLVCAHQLHATPKLLHSFIILAVVSIIAIGTYVLGQFSVGSVIGGLIGFIIWQPIFFFIIIPYRTKRTFRQLKNLHRCHFFWWDNEMISFQSQDFKGNIRWTDFIKVKENRKMFLLYQSDTFFNVIPKYCFNGSDDLEDFKACISAVPKS